MASEKSEHKITIPAELSGILQKHHDTVIADASISDLDVILISIYLLENENKKAGAHYDEVKKLFISFGRKNDNFKVNVFLAKKRGILSEKDRTFYFQSIGLKKIRDMIGQVGKSPVFIVKSGENFSAIKSFEEFLDSNVTGEVLLCDSYISHLTLFPFSILKGKMKSLKILTSKIHESEKFEEYKNKLASELNISVDFKKNKKIHDRFIIYSDKCWSFGASIKDLGNKDTIIKDISEVYSSMKELFNERWSEN